MLQLSFYLVASVVSVGDNNIPGYCKILCEDESESGNWNFLVKQDGRCQWVG